MPTPFHNQPKEAQSVRVERAALEAPLISAVLTAEAFLSQRTAMVDETDDIGEDGRTLDGRTVRAFFVGDRVVAAYALAAAPRPSALAPPRSVWISRSLPRAVRAWVYSAYLVDIAQPGTEAPRSPGKA